LYCRLLPAGCNILVLAFALRFMYGQAALPSIESA
jgi:hypothetical protein